MSRIEITAKYRDSVDFDELVTTRKTEVLTAAARFFKQRLAENLQSKLSATQFSDDAVKKYPWLRDPGLCDKIMQAIYVRLVHDDMSVIVNRQVLADLGLPADILDILEYGDSSVPALFVVRRTIDDVTQTPVTEYPA